MCRLVFVESPKVKSLSILYLDGHIMHEYSFSFTENYTEMTINSTDMGIGDYDIVLESFDAASSVESTLKSDSLQI